MRRPAARHAAVVTLAYLVVTLPLFWRAAWTTTRTILLIAHLAAAGCLAWSLRTRRGSALADWLPLLLVPFLYAELPALIGPVGYNDAVVQGWEAVLFGMQPARTFASAIPSVALSEALHLGYVLYYPIIVVLPLLLYLTDRAEEYGTTVLAVMLTYVVCFLAFVAFPVEGPRYAWGPSADVPRGPLRSLTLLLLERGSSRGTAFPSSHAAIAVAQSVAGLRYQARVGVPIAVASVLLVLGAVYGGFHYAIDVVVGIVIGLVISLSVLAWRR